MIASTTDAPTITPAYNTLAVQAEPLLVNARDAGRLCSVSERLWRSWDSAGKCPEAVLNGTGVKRWGFDELKRWVAADCPARSRWAAMSA